MDTIGALLLVVVGSVIVVFLLLGAALRAAYRGGVRDGYSNTWLPHVQDQIIEEHLRQGEEVIWHEDP